MESNKHKVFVYGTLRPTKTNAYEEATHVLFQYDMYNYNFRFPYIKESSDPDSRVHGNLLEVDDEQLAALDKYEGVDRELYKRIRVVVWDMDDEDDPANAINAWVYVADEIDLQVKSGDWNDV